MYLKYLMYTVCYMNWAIFRIALHSKEKQHKRKPHTNLELLIILEMTFCSNPEGILQNFGSDPDQYDTT